MQIRWWSRGTDFRANGGLQVTDSVPNCSPRLCIGYMARNAGEIAIFRVVVSPWRGKVFGWIGEATTDYKGSVAYLGYTVVSCQQLRLCNFEAHLLSDSNNLSMFKRTEKLWDIFHYEDDRS